MREYSSFEQIEHDLKILKLKRQISEEEVRLNVNGAKNGMSSGFSPVSSLGTVLGSLIQKAVVTKLLGTIFGYKRVKEVNKKGDYKV